LADLTVQIIHLRKENDFDEIDLRHIQEKLKQLTEELDKPPYISIQQDTVSLIHRISVAVPRRPKPLPVEPGSGITLPFGWINQ
jgi:hypothetical protein